jgi:predicted MPP superfamily phosphohydrolase
MPLVRHLVYREPNWPTGQPRLRILLATDLHVLNVGGSLKRIERVVDQINGLHPDLILLGGDFVGGQVQDRPDRYVIPALAPLKRLHAPLGIVAVLGNHDHLSDPPLIRQALRAAHIRILTNSATTLGPLVIGGLDDQYTHHARLIPTEIAMAEREGVRILLAHSPDVFAFERLPIGLTLVGHTHCGQIALPVYGPILTATALGRRFACGVYSAGGRTLVVSGGIGTSQIPLRLFAPPDIWLIEVGPA